MFTDRRAVAAIGLIASLTVVGAATTASAGPPQDGGETARYVVMFQGGGVPSDAAALIGAAGGTAVRVLPEVGLAVATTTSTSFVTKVKRNATVQDAGILPAQALPDTTDGGLLESGPTGADDLYNTGLLWGVQRVHAPEAWSRGITGSHDTVVAVIDTGIATNHPDLAPNIVHTACYSTAGSDADGGCLPYPSLSDHGTHVAGTVAAAFGGGRVVGVGPDLGLAGYNVFEAIPGCGVCAYSDIRWLAMLDAADRGYEVINMSLGGITQRGGKGTNDLTAYYRAEDRVTRYVIGKGTTVVASAGNEDLDLTGRVDHVPSRSPGVISVGATGIRPEPRYVAGTSTDVRAFYSNYGSEVDLAGPGGDCGQDDACDSGRPANWPEYLVLSTTVTPSPACAASASCPVWYGWKGGTSMAAPHVAGVAGLVRDTQDLSPHEVADLLTSTADKVGSRLEFGHGIVDADAATM